MVGHHYQGYTDIGGNYFVVTYDVDALGYEYIQLNREQYEALLKKAGFEPTYE